MLYYVNILLLTTTGDYVEKAKIGDHQFLKVEPQALTLLTEQAMTDMAHLFRTSHLQVG